MCDLCNNNVARSYTHSRTREHKKRLFECMKKKKQNSIKLLGYFKY